MIYDDMIFKSMYDTIFIVMLLCHACYDGTINIACDMISCHDMMLCDETKSSDTTPMYIFQKNCCNTYEAGGTHSS